MTIADSPDLNPVADTAEAGPVTVAQRCRAAVRALRDLARYRAEEQASIEEDHRSATESAHSEHETSLGALTRKRDEDLARASKARQRGSAEMSALYEARLREATAKHERERTSLVARLDASQKKAEKGLRDAKFLAEAVTDAGRSHPSQEVERVRREARAELETLLALEGAVRRVAGRRVPIDTEAEPDEDHGIAFEGESPPLDRLILLRQDIETRYRSLRIAWIHWLFENGLQIGVIALALIGAIFVGFIVGMIEGDAIEGAKIGGMILGGGAVLVLLTWPARRIELARMRAQVAPIEQRLRYARSLAHEAVESAVTFRNKAEREIRERHETEVSKQRDKYLKRVDKLVEEREREVETVDRKHREESESIDSEHRAEAQRFETEASDREASIRSEFETESAALSKKRDEAIDVAERRRVERADALRRAWREGYGSIATELAFVNERAAVSCPSWPETLRSSELSSELFPAIAYGRYSIDVASLEGGLPDEPEMMNELPPAFDAPALLDFPGPSSLLVLSGPATRDRGLETIRNAMLRLLTCLPPGKARFTMIDPVGLGQSFAGFMRLADHDEKLVTSRIWTELRHIEQRLSDLTEHMETVIQKYLRNEFDSIEAYNAAAGEIAEPYRFLVVADFPKGFSDEAARRLASIVESGPRCGVYTLVQGDPSAKLPDTISYDTLRSGASVLVDGGADGFAPDDADYDGLPLVVETPPNDAEIADLLDRIGEGAHTAGRVEVPFSRLSPDDSDVWSADASEELSVSVGRAGATKLQRLMLGRGTSQHALIAGKTGSGKSTLLHVIITNAGLWYSPSEVELYLVDFKKGVEFKAYADDRLPHCRAVAVESDREFGLSVLRRLDNELKRRGDLFRAHGAQSLAAARREAPDEHLPRVLLIIDEFQEFFTEDDSIAQDAALLLDRLVRQGRAFGMHVLLGSQTLSGAYTLARSTVGQMAVRIALQCSETDSYLILSEDNAAARLLSRPGEAIYNDANGLLEGNNPFQVAWLADVDRDAALDAVCDRVAKSDWEPPHPQIVFEGNVAADLARNHLLTEALEAAPAEGGVVGRGPLLAWLGEPVAIKDATAGTLSRQAGANLLIVGQQDETSRAMMGSALLGLAAQMKSRGGSIRFIDTTPPDDPDAESLGDLAESARHVTGVDIEVVGARDAAGVLSELDAERERRDADPTGHPPIVLMVHGLQRLRALRKKEDEFNFSFSASDDDDSSGADPSQQFADIVRDGPSLGLHAVVWCDTYSNLTRIMSRQAIGEFEQRAVLQMGASDSSNLIDTPAAGKLGMNRGLLFNEELGTLEKFRPYRMPDPGLLERLRG